MDALAKLESLQVDKKTSYTTDANLEDELNREIQEMTRLTENNFFF